MKNIRVTTTVIAISFFIFSCSSDPVDIDFNFESYTDEYSRLGTSIVESQIKNSYTIGFGFVDMPLNKIVLLNSDENICAVRFTEFQRFNDSKKSTVFSSNSETFKATVEMINVEKRKSLFSKEYEIETYNFEEKATYGIGRLTFGGGDKHIECGNSGFLWMYPTSILLNENKATEAFFPTTFEKFSEMAKLKHPIAWYFYDDDRKRQIMSFEEIDSLR